MAIPDFTVEPLADGGIEELEPLWNALREHHAAAMPAWGEPRSREESWAVRRPEYVGWLAEPGAFCLVARDDAGRAVGYAMVRLHGPTAIWPSERSAELETLSVLPEARSSGVGGALINAVRAALAEEGVESMAISVLHANVDGLRFYEREGFRTGIQIVFGPTVPRAT